MYGTTLVGERKRTASHSEYVGMAGYVDDCEIDGTRRVLPHAKLLALVLMENVYSKLCVVWATNGRLSRLALFRQRSHP